MGKFLFLALLLLSPTVYGAEHPETAFERVSRTGVLRCGITPWPPLLEIDPNTSEIKGPHRELFESIIHLTGWKVEFVPTVLGTEPLDLQNGKIDAMCAHGPWTITNIKTVDYTTFAVYFPVQLYVREKDDRFKQYSDLDQETVSFVGIDGDTSSELAQVRFPKAKIRTLINLTDPGQMILEVANGKADAVIIDLATAGTFMKNNPGKIRPISTRGPFAVYPAGMAVRPGETQLQQVLSRAVEMGINIGLVDQKIDLYDPTHETVYAPQKLYRSSK